ncbi:MAG: extracellular solute-binding protein, partial [Alphaproteobacteria bacterium]|nr:extracellular solute-binding protein [Alphaproteobacteria bacterium]
KSFVMPKFQKEHDAKLVFDIGSMGARYNKIRAQKGLSTVDVFFSTDEPVYNGMRTGLFAEINPKNIPNMADLHDWATPTKGFGVGYGLITFGLAYHTGLVKNPPTSWNDLWRKDISSKVALPALFHSLMPALLIRSSELGGGSATNLGPGLARLSKLRPKKLSYFWTAWAPLLKSGDVHVAAEFDYYIEGMKDKGYPVAWNNPTDKGFATFQHLSIPKASKNKELAEAFLNAMLDPGVQEAIANKTYQGPTNKKVKLKPAVAIRSTYGDRLKNIRFFDGREIDKKRLAISEMLKTKVLPNWS